MDLEQNYQRLHLFPLSQLSCTYMRVEEERGAFPNAFAVEKVPEWAGGL